MPNTWTTYDRTETFTPGTATEKPKLSVEWNNGVTDKLEGDAALANYGGAEGQRFRQENPLQAADQRLSRQNDPRFSTSYQLGQATRDAITNPSSFYNRLFDKGPVAGAAAGGGLGLLGGILANWASDYASGAMGFGERSMDYRLLGSLVGAGLGGMIGHNHLKPQVKQAAMFVDPRNFILEKLQSANDVSAGDRVRLAAAVRNMSTYDAEQLAKQLRATLGFSVGVIIARALHMSLGVSLVSGFLGALGLNGLYNRF